MASRSQPPGPSAIASLPNHVLPSVFHYLTWSLPEYLALGVVCKRWREFILCDDGVLRTILVRCLTEARWFAAHGKMKQENDGSVDPLPLDTALHDGTFEFPLVPDSVAPGAVLARLDSTGDGVLASIAEESIAHLEGGSSSGSPFVHTPGSSPSPHPNSLACWLATAESQGAAFDFGDFKRLDGEISWVQPLMRFHCSPTNYKREVRIGNERSSYYRATVLTSRRIVCVKDCMDHREEHLEGIPPR